MLSRKRLSVSLSGLSGTDFWSYWNAIKNQIGDMQTVGLKIVGEATRLGTAVQNLKARGRQDLIDILQPKIQQINDDLAKYWKVKGYLDKYLPEWMKAAQSGSVSTNLSALPIVLGVASIAALAYVVTQGMALIQKYQTSKSIINMVGAGTLTAEQGKTLQEADPGGGFFDKLGLGLGVGIPAVLLIGGGIYLVMATGMLKGLFGGSRS